MTKDYRARGEDQENLINRLKRQVHEAAGGKMTVWESESLSPDQRADFWRRVSDFTKPWTNTGR